MTRRARAPVCGSDPAGVLMQYAEEAKEAQRGQRGWLWHCSRQFMHSPGLNKIHQDLFRVTGEEHSDSPASGRTCAKRRR